MAAVDAAERKEGNTAWLSRGLEELLYELHHDPGKAQTGYDVVIVGSGYGGAIAAAELAGCTHKGREISVCVLERGREYLPGMFPSRFSDLPGHMRFSTPASPQPRGRREGLFDIRLGPHVNAVLANGLGGGSLINAGVMAEPAPAVLRGRWPKEIADDLTADFFSEVRELLGAKDSTIDRHPKGIPLKHDALQALDRRGVFKRPTIQVALTDDTSGLARTECKLCGDCATGCNHGAKISLDTSLLHQAKVNGSGRVDIVTGATVLKLERRKDEWELHVVHTDGELRKRQDGTAKLRARKVILAAGTFGSTEILLRSRSDGLPLSPSLGQRFSSNGDAIAVLYDQGRLVNAVADESVDPGERGVGPTITGMLDLREHGGHVIQEIAIPGPLRRVFEEVVTTANALYALEDRDRSAHGDGQPPSDPCSVDPAALCRSSVFVMMGDDGAAGALERVGDSREQDGDGAIMVRWPEAPDLPLYQDQLKTLRGLAGKDARILPNPMWQLLPPLMQIIFETPRGPVLTVHPLGGCPMGANASQGVVDQMGRVFDAGAGFATTSTFEGLAVLDGSIVPRALGINPALTIAALALRAVRLLRQQWEYEKPNARIPAPQLSRPRFQPAPGAATSVATEAELIERMSGDVVLERRGGGRVDCRVELRMRFHRHSLQRLVRPPAGDAGARILSVRDGELRVYRKSVWQAWRRRGEPEERLARLAELRAPLSGNLILLEREASTFTERRCRALWAWLLNRGIRDSWQLLGKRLIRWLSRTPEPRNARRELPLREDLWERLKGSIDLASHAGEVRLLRYELTMGNLTRRRGTQIGFEEFIPGARIRGRKRLTYSRKGNPWRQLMEMTLEQFPGMDLCSSTPILELDTKYLAQKGIPLLRIASQTDQASALADVGSFLGYFLRLLIHIHVWSFRRPDSAPTRELQRLPQRIPGRLPEPEVRELDVDQLPDGAPVRVRLTCYRPFWPRGRPVVLIHGYSASGTTFAHHALRPGMAEYFYNRGREVWVLDLRTSSGMPTARHPWAFEEAALADIPAAIDEICRMRNARNVDIFAHCMGSAMFSMAVLSRPKPGERYYAERLALPLRVHRAALSQISPIVIMTPANLFRGYAMSYLRYFMPFANYDFRVGPDPGLADQLIDRLLATLPYPEEEFCVENPLFRSAPFVGTRHRMDALYGRDFSVADKAGRPLLSDEVREYIDDLFGPLSIETVAQAIHFARQEVITTRAGRNEFVLPNHVLERWTFPTLSIHGTENGLSDVATLARFRRRFRDDAGINIAVAEFPGFGHQDSLIGTRAPEVFERVFDFLTKEELDAHERP